MPWPATASSPTTDRWVTPASLVGHYPGAREAPRCCFHLTHPFSFFPPHSTLSQLACARVSSPEGQDYLAAMAAAANYAWVNRSSMTFLTRQAFAKQFGKVPKRPPTRLALPAPVTHTRWHAPGAGRAGHARDLRREPQHRQGTLLVQLTTRLPPLPPRPRRLGYFAHTNDPFNGLLQPTNLSF